MVEVPWHAKAAESIGRIIHSNATETLCESKLHGGFRATFEHSDGGNHRVTVDSFLGHRDMDAPEQGRESLIVGVVGLHGGVRFNNAEHIKVSDLGKLAKAVQTAHAALQKHAPK